MSGVKEFRGLNGPHYPSLGQSPKIDTVIRQNLLEFRESLRMLTKSTKARTDEEWKRRKFQTRNPGG